ncbi:MAG: winged helix-turn-helix transcriptional regulator [Candidatus Bathyarchaeia archaeon]
MRRKEIVSVLLIAMVFSFSYLAIAYSHGNNANLAVFQQVDNARQFIFSSSLVIGANLHDNSTLLNQPTRLKIYNFVKDNPGIHFRAICESLNLPIGVVQYHLNSLANAGLVSVYTDGMYKRYFQSKTFTDNEMKIISLLRHDTIKSILALLSQTGSKTHKEIASKIGISSQALTSQMNRLKKIKLINIIKEDIKVTYSINQEKADIIKQYLTFLLNF